MFRRSVRDLLPGDHAWLPYGSESEQGHVIGDWIRYGLSIRDKIIYVTDAEPWELPGMFGEDLGPAIRTGLLSLIPVGEACLSGGMFDPAKMVETLTDEITKATEQQFRGIRVTADTSWAFAEPFGDARLDSCEREFSGHVCPSVSVTAICQTDIRKCTGTQLELLKQHHEVLAIPNPDFDDPVLSITKTYQPLGLQLVGELDEARQQRFEEVLNSVSPNGEAVHLDMEKLDFVSLRALQAMAEYTRRRGPTSRVVLHRVASDVESVIKTVGIEKLPGVIMGDAS
ncbi:hypothetical protein GCM10027589_44630 [Actinocorallia lasiicapitis]